MSVVRGHNRLPLYSGASLEAKGKESTHSNTGDLKGLDTQCVVLMGRVDNLTPPARSRPSIRK